MIIFRYSTEVFILYNTVLAVTLKEVPVKLHHLNRKVEISSNHLLKKKKKVSFLCWHQSEFLVMQSERLKFRYNTLFPSSLKDDIDGYKYIIIQFNISLSYMYNLITV